MRTLNLTGVLPSTRTLWLIATLAASGLDAISAEPSPATSASDRNYIVYVGLNVAVETGTEESPVVDSGEKHLTVMRAGRREQVALRDAKFQLNMEPKLSRHQLTIDDLKGETGYSARTDPGRDAMRQQMVMDEMQGHNLMIAQRQEAFAIREVEILEMTRASELAAGRVPTVTLEQIDQANVVASLATTNVNTTYTTPVYSAGARGLIGAEGNQGFDAFEVTFRLSAPERREEMLGLLRMQMRDPATSATPTSVLKFFTVRNVGPEPRRISVLQTGLPVGFIVDSYTIHLYEDGQEIPTNLAKNRMELNAAEAHQFLVLRHAHMNQAASLPPQLLRELIPADMAERLRSFAPGTTVELGIDESGRVTTVKAPLPEGDPRHATLSAIFGDVPFLPALQNGGAVASTGTFTVAEFAP